jgi:hypothetical protein
MSLNRYFATLLENTGALHIVLVRDDAVRSTRRENDDRITLQMQSLNHSNRSNQQVKGDADSYSYKKLKSPVRRIFLESIMETSPQRDHGREIL